MHTPGPWKLIDCLGRCEVYAGRRQLIAFRDPDNENKANARLIAAAPDLLDACETLLLYLPHELQFIDGVVKARAVIANATGAPHV